MPPETGAGINRRTRIDNLRRQRWHSSLRRRKASPRRLDSVR